MARPKPKHKVKFLLRLPAELHKKLAESAAGNSPANSLHYEILSRLYDSVSSDEDGGDLHAEVAQLRKQIAALTEGKA